MYLFLTLLACNFGFDMNPGDECPNPGTKVIETIDGETACHTEKTACEYNCEIVKSQCLKGMSEGQQTICYQSNDKCRAECP